MESFNSCPEYQSELVEYEVGAFTTYFEKVSQVLTEKGMDATMLVLTELKEALIPSKLTSQKASKPSLSVT